MTENKITDKSFIKTYDKLISPQDCDAAIEYFKRQDGFNKAFSRVELENASHILKSDKSVQIDETNYDVLVDDTKLASLFINLENALKIYLKETNILEYLDIKELHWEPQKIQKTIPGGGYHIWHIEKGGDTIMSLRRCLVYTLYLNDVEDGGETEFLLQSVRVKPKKGRICFFPAHFPYLHRGNPPLSGEKYIMTSWFTLRIK